MSVEAELERFIVGELTVGRGIESIEPDEDLLARGIVDSHGVMELVGFLEERFGLRIRDEDLTPENFQSISRIEAFVATRGEH